MKQESHDDDFISSVRKQEERFRKGRNPSLWTSIGIVGTIGWMVVLPALCGIVLGRYLDAHLNLGVFWTLSLLTFGLVLGCAAAWRQIREAMKE